MQETLLTIRNRLREGLESGFTHELRAREPVASEAIVEAVTDALALIDKLEGRE